MNIFDIGSTLGWMIARPLGPTYLLPVADFSSITTLMEVEFFDSTVKDPDLAIESYDWDFGDGTTHGTTSHEVHTYATPGAKTVRLTVVDSMGATDFVEKVVTPVQPDIAWGFPLEAASSTTGGLVFVTGSVEPASDLPVYISFVAGEMSDVQATDPVVTGCGLTWVKVHNRVINGNYMRMYVFRACGTVVAGAITITFAGIVTRNACAWVIFQGENVDAGGTDGSASVVQANAGVQGNSTTGTSTLAALGSSRNHHVCTIALAYAEVEVTVDPQFTMIGTDSETADSIRIAVMYAKNETTCDPTWASNHFAMVSMEIKAA